jgi:hypothetical protein
MLCRHQQEILNYQCRLPSPAPHLFKIAMGEVVDTNVFRIACRHQFSAYTILLGAPINFCTLNIVDIHYPAAAAAAAADSAIEIKKLLLLQRSSKRIKLQHTSDGDN